MKIAFRCLIQFYRFFISPMLAPRCRFFPSCSTYALEALEQHSLGYALWLIIKRIGRCHPWGGSGYDPVPESKAQNPKNDSKIKRIIQTRLKTILSQYACASCCVVTQEKGHAQLGQFDKNSHTGYKFKLYNSSPHRH
jgi:uncharacterized protein